jgi:hypothetical protein
LYRRKRRVDSIIQKIAEERNARKFNLRRTDSR